MRRKPFIAGNWKMHKTIPEAVALVEGLKQELAGVTAVDVAVCPPFTALAPLREALAGSPIKLGAQDLYWEEKGAFTGEVSPLMLKDAGCELVIIGHSERRGYFGETDEMVARKLQAALRYGLGPILCVGETLQEREAGQVQTVLERQIKADLAQVKPEELPRVTIAYEPIWAIGTGWSATAADAQEAISFIRRTLAGLFTAALAEQVRIQYGGSVKPDNIAGFMAQPDIDGALVGGASLEAAGFAALVKAAAR